MIQGSIALAWKDECYLFREYNSNVIFEQLVVLTWERYGYCYLGISHVEMKIICKSCVLLLCAGPDASVIVMGEKLRMLHHLLWTASAALGRWCWGRMITIPFAFTLNPDLVWVWVCLRIGHFVQVRNSGVRCPTVARRELVHLWLLPHRSLYHPEGIAGSQFLPWPLPGLQVSFVLLHLFCE